MESCRGFRQSPASLVQSLRLDQRDGEKIIVHRVSLVTFQLASRIFLLFLGLSSWPPGLCRRLVGVCIYGSFVFRLWRINLSEAQSWPRRHWLQ